MKNKPNVLILFTDQQRYNTIAHLGYDYMITPNLDRLAKESCSYVNAISTNPVCMPARHDLLTGMGGHAHGYYGNSIAPIKDYSLPTLPRIFLNNGYATAAVGKMHFVPVREHHGFGEMHLMEELPGHRNDDAYATYLEAEGLGGVQNIHGVRPQIYHIPQNSQMDEEHCGTPWVAKKTIEWISENKDRPFFLMSSWIQPHPPWHLPKSYQDMYKDRDIPEPYPLSRPATFEKGLNGIYGDFDSDELKRKTREAYYASVSMVDENIGKILDYMEKEKLLDNTLIIFTSDHGEMLQDKGFYSKALPYDGSVRIPFVVRYPERFAPNTICEDFVDLFDVLPTCLDVCGLEYPGIKARLQGDSVCASNPTRDRNVICSNFHENATRWVMARDHEYKYVFRYNGGHEELYDMKNDPMELCNLIAAGSYPRGPYEKLKKDAFEYEAVNIPDSLKPGGILTGRDTNVGYRTDFTKFPFWANMQVQGFDSRSGQARGESFVQEMAYALDNPNACGFRQSDVYSNELLEETLRKTWAEFTDGKVDIKNVY